MKRHEALAPLSREHHEALILSRLLRKDAPAYKNLPVELGEKAQHALDMYNKSLQDHFLKEEKMLEVVKQYDAEIERITDEIIAEHRLLTNAFMALKVEDGLAEAMDTLGINLETHIRKEERILFPLVEKYCPEEILKTIVYQF